MSKTRKATTASRPRIIQKWDLPLLASTPWSFFSTYVTIHGDEKVQIDDRCISQK
jgi:hypothetical protein